MLALEQVNFKGQNAPLVSVIMPVYNGENSVCESIESVLAQTYREFELIIVDDASTDSTSSVLERKSMQDSRVKIFTHEANKGVAAARNTALEFAKGEYIAFLDSDDIWFPTKLERQAEVLAGGVCVVFSRYRKRYATGAVKQVAAREIITYRDMLYGNPIGNLTGIYNSKRLGVFSQLPVGHEDYLMWIHVVKAAGSAVGIQDCLAEYRVLNNSLSSDKWRSARWTWNIYRNEIGLNLAKSLISFFCYVAGSVWNRLSEKN